MYSNFVAVLFTKISDMKRKIAMLTTGLFFYKRK